MPNNTTNVFLQTGQVPNSSREKSALLDDLRSQLLSQKNKNMTDKTDYPSCHFTAQSPDAFKQEYNKIMAIAAEAKAIRLPSRTAKNPAVSVPAGLADARNKRDAAIRELSKLTGRSIADIQADPKFARKVKPSPVPTAKASPATAKDALSIYNSLPSGPAKHQFLIKNAVAIQNAAKSRKA